MLGFSIAQISSIVQGEIEGDPSAMIYDFGKIETAKTGDITFLANLKYESCLYTTQASCVLISKEYRLKHSIKPNLIRVDNPYQALTKLLAEYQKLQARTLKGVHKKAIVLTKKTIPKSAYIGPGAVLEEGVEIGENAQIHALAYLGAGVKIGASSIIYPQVCVYSGCQIGARCIIHSGAVIGADGFGFSPNSDGSYTKIPQIGTVIIEEDVEIGANSTVDRATMGETRIRKGAKIDNLVQIGHNVEIGEYTVIAGQSGIAGSAKIGNRVMIAGQAGISGHLSIGDGAVLGPQSGISNRVKAGDKLLGSPAMPVNIYMKNMVHFRNLSQLIERIEKLEKHYHHLSKEQ